MKRNKLYIIFTICLSLICLEAMSHIAMAAHDEQCHFITNPMFVELDIKKKFMLCDDLKSIKYTNSKIRLHEPDQHYNFININSFGFRGDNFDIEKADKEYRVFVLGSSMIMGLGATSDETTIPSFLQEKFQELGLDHVTVVNAGIISANSASEVYMINEILPKYEPDMIIVYEGYTDSWNIPIYDIKIGEEQRINHKTDIENFIKNNLDQFMTPKLIYQKTHDYLQITKTDKDIMIKNAEFWKNRWSKTCELQEIPILILMQPMIGIGDKKLTDSEKVYYKKGKHASILPAYSEILPVSSETNCKYVYDITNVFDSYSENIYVTSAHLTDNGNKIIAEKMLELSLPIITEK